MVLIGTKIKEKKSGMIKRRITIVHSHSLCDYLYTHTHTHTHKFIKFYKLLKQINKLDDCYYNVKIRNSVVFLYNNKNQEIFLK